MIRGIVATVIFSLCMLRAVAAAASPAVSVPALKADHGVDDGLWNKAASIELSYDFTYRRPANEATTVRIFQDDGALYVEFSVRQQEPITAGQHTNGNSVLNDDYVGVYLDPLGDHGFAYAFYANPNGARYQTSTENSAYSPEWEATAKIQDHGYDVRMRIPLNVIRGNSAHSWRAQFVRFAVASNSLSVWSYSSDAQSVSDPAFLGTINDIGASSALISKPAPRNQPRLQVYGLGEVTTPEQGGNTSRVGADFSLPITPTASFVGTLHPDYSNVEVDQQTIAPTAFARQYSEVRPFFTQLASFFNDHFGCTNCPTVLYTPSIPTFPQGYGVEGTQGRLSVAAFQALGDDRTDQAETVNYSYEDTAKSIVASVQRVNVAAYGLMDNTLTYNAGYLDQRSHLFAYANEGVQSGTLVSDPSLGRYFEIGAGYSSATQSLIIDRQGIGAEFNPLDGYTAQNDILGYQAVWNRTFNFAPSAFLHDIALSEYYARYWNSLNDIAQTDSDPQVNFDFRDLVSIHLFAGSNGVRTVADEFLPFNQNGAFLGYRANTNTPSYVLFSGGPYYHGQLVAWSYVTTLPVTRRVHLALEADQSKYLTEFTGEESTDQWLERISLDWQFTKALELDVGDRRIIGSNLPNSIEAWVPPNSDVCAENPYMPGCFVDASNVSVALHFLAARNEFYLVYGNPNDLSTLPAFFVKWIRYVGAEKGT
jgi:hypothetical protein